MLAGVAFEGPRCGIRLGTGRPSRGTRRIPLREFGSTRQPPRAYRAEFPALGVHGAVPLDIHAQRPRTYAAARPPFASCHGVSTRGPFAVTAIVNSKCAASDPSWE